MVESINEVGRSDTERLFEAVIRLGIVALLLAYAFKILSPFIHLVVWSTIFAVAVYPLFLRFRSLLGGRNKLAATLFTLIVIAVMVVPAAKLAVGSVEGARELANEWRVGTVHLPAPTAKIKELPLVGERAYAFWLDASRNLEETIRRFAEPLKKVGAAVLHGIAGTSLTIVLFAFSVIIAGVLMANAEAGRRATLALSRRLAGDSGDELVELAVATVRSVTQGVLGVAFIQAILATIGLAVMGVPLVGVWALIVLILAVVQLPPILVLGPIAAWSFSAHSATAATIFAIYCVLVSFADSFLKPIFLGRGVNVPMLVILLGAMGGMISSGIIGLFIGAVILALIYRLFIAWLAQGATGDAATAAAGAAPSDD